MCRQNPVMAYCTWVAGWASWLCLYHFCQSRRKSEAPLHCPTSVAQHHALDVTVATLTFAYYSPQMGSLLGAMTPGTTPPKLLCFIALPPRLDPVVHTPYAVRYYTAVPPAAEGSEPLLSFDALQARVTQRVTEGGCSGWVSWDEQELAPGWHACML
jgi:hypothetical protein